jgi:hypothetical protein
VGMCPLRRLYGGREVGGIMGDAYGLCRSWNRPMNKNETLNSSGLRLVIDMLCRDVACYSQHRCKRFLEHFCSNCLLHQKLHFSAITETDYMQQTAAHPTA